MVWLWILIAIVALLAIIVIYFYNRIAVLSNRIENSLSQIDVQLRKRGELVPNLINSVKGYMKHEKKIMNQVSKSREVLIKAKTLESRAKAGAELQSALKDVFAIAENYPQLRANENFLQLQNELSAIEDRIAYARQFYNDSILAYNNLVTTFPGNSFAKMFNKSKKDYLQIPTETKAVPKVSFE